MNKKWERPTSPDVERAFIYWFSLKKSSTVKLNTAFWKGSVMAYGCFISTGYWKEKLFLQFFRWRTSWWGNFIGYSFGISRNKTSTLSYDTAFGKDCVVESGWYLFLWSSKGITNKMSQPWSPPRGKLEKKAVFSPCCGDETTTNMTGPFGLPGGNRFFLRWKPWRQDV